MMEPKKLFLTVVAFVLFVGYAMSQEKASPARSVSKTVNGTDITINYSSPAVKGRTIWGGLVPYDKVWRTGANEATTIEVSNDVKIAGKVLKAGKYALFTVPGNDKWQVIINSVANQWGAYGYDASKDIMKFETTPSENSMTERLKFDISDGGTVSMAWEKLSISFDVK